MDRRLFRANGRVAHSALRGLAEVKRFVEGDVRCVTAPWTDLCREPNGARDKQLVFGQRFETLDSQSGWTFGFDPVDGYVGYVADAALGPVQTATHRVVARTAHRYSRANFKSPETGLLSHGSCLSVTRFENGFACLADGSFVAGQHIAPQGELARDTAGTAELFLGTPYLWGGNTGFGIDCSGLVQCALHSAGLDCPRDSDMQSAEWATVPERAALRRGDLVFWAGHVGMMRDGDMLIHANAHHMCVATEPLDQAIARIGQNEFGAVTRLARPAQES